MNDPPVSARFPYRDLHALALFLQVSAINRDCLRNNGMAQWLKLLSQVPYSTNGLKNNCPGIVIKEKRVGESVPCAFGRIQFVPELFVVDIAMQVVQLQ